MKTYIVNWNGPYDIERLDKGYNKSIIYLITGFQKSRKTISTYIGITERCVTSRFYDRNHKHCLITRDKKIWLGTVKNKKPNRNDLELLESLLVYFWQCDLNQKKKVNPPEPTAIINRWYNTNNQLRKRISHPAQHLDDVIYWDGEYWHHSQRMDVFED